MKYRTLGKSGIEASVVGFGAWAIGGWMWGGTKRNDPEGAIRAAIDHGINLIDTAPMYGYGRSEELVGEALKGVRVRSCSQPSAASSGTKKKAISFSTRT